MPDIDSRSRRIGGSERLVGGPAWPHTTSGPGDTAYGVNRTRPLPDALTMPLPAGTTTAYGAADTAGTALPVAAYPASSQAMRDAESTATGRMPQLGAPPVGVADRGAHGARPGTSPTVPAPTIERAPGAAARGSFVANAAPWPSSGSDLAPGGAPNAGVVLSVAPSGGPAGRGRARRTGATVTHIAEAASAVDRSTGSNGPTGPAPRLRGSRRGTASSVAPVIEPAPVDPAHEHADAPGLAPAVEAPSFGGPATGDAGRHPSTASGAPEPRSPWDVEPAHAPAGHAGAIDHGAAAPSARPWPGAGQPAPAALPDVAPMPTPPAFGEPSHPGAAPGVGPTASGPATDASSEPSTITASDASGPAALTRLTRSTGRATPFALTADRFVLAAVIALAALVLFAIAGDVLTTALTAAGPSAFFTATWMIDFLVAVAGLVTAFLGGVGFLRTERTSLVAFGAGAVGAFVAVTHVLGLVVSMVQVAVGA